MDALDFLNNVSKNAFQKEGLTYNVSKDTKKESLLTVDIEGKYYNCHIELNHKISIVLGDSGVGKTIFTYISAVKRAGYKVNVSDNAEVIWLINGWELVLKGLQKDNGKKYLCIVDDDDDFLFSNEFASMYNKTVNTCFMIIVRTQENKERLKKWNSISIDADAVYEFKADGKYHFLIPYNRFGTVSKLPEKKIDSILCEDKESGYTFFSNMFKECYTAEGKNKLLDYIINNEHLFINRQVYLVVDYAAMGLLLEDILSYLNQLGTTVYLSSDYKSFEYMILRSNFYGINKDEIHRDLLSYPSLEVRSTELVEELSKGKVYSYTKGRLKPCYYKDCCELNQKNIQCDKGVAIDKLEFMLIDTEFDFLLTLREG